MVTAVSGSSSAGASPSGGRTLDAQLAKSQVQLSDWTHCVSAKTPQGKQKIAEISAKVDDIKAKMKAAEQSRPQPGAAQDAQTASATSTPTGVGTLGHTLNVFA